MATIEELETSNELVRIEVPLDGADQSWRRLYGTPDFVHWLDHVLPDVISTFVGAELSPFEQVFARFEEYIVGEKLADDRRFKTLSWTPEQFVWEFKTLDIRVFGWFPERDVFICAYGETKDQIELMNSYGRFIAQTSYVRLLLPLNEPKYIASKDHKDVLSNADR